MFFLIISYLLVLAAGGAIAIATLALGYLPAQFEPLRIPLTCCLTGLIGGCLYCIRAVYLNRSVRKSWDTDWHSWYFLRPLTSFICGGVSFLFLKAGLLVLESNTKENASEIGFYALAFVAGLNVDKFVAKIEGVAHAVWGIEKSRSAAASTDDKKMEKENG
ncbi:hypothetical protein KGP65_01405 [Burkholderia multivorans]|nr:hypothetical protein [Burkholderia multivorans]MCO8314696.1 hypothetical protein [Burkholderia multivorans]MCO8425207.1 hypothetical protein [Burkholderia multivorans]MCO8438215.1 hypothetical protein [Burkholderia multivorans]MCO8543070.1 hypothetical protein [Burkholderia multivorans]